MRLWTFALLPSSTFPAESDSANKAPDPELVIDLQVTRLLCVINIDYGSPLPYI